MRAAGNLLKNPFFISLFASVFFLGISIFLIFSAKGRLPLAVPIWFFKPWGEDRLADPNFLWLIPTTNTFLVFINLAIAYYFRKKERILSSILVWVAPIISIMFFYTLFKIVSVAT